MSILIEGLPDDVAIRCLACVPFYLHPKLEKVSVSWREAIRSLELFKAREELNSSEDLLCVCAYYPERLWQLYDPVRGLWITLPLLPSKVKQLVYFGVQSVLGKIFVIGGRSSVIGPLKGQVVTNEVWSYDPISRSWATIAPMIVPRAMFACCVSGGKIIVAGGFTCGGKSISKAEVYDPKKDIWSPLPDLNHIRNTACSGLVIGEKVHVFHKGSTTVQILDSVKLKWDIMECGWIEDSMAVVRGSVYIMSRGFLYKRERDENKLVVSASRFRKRSRFAMVGLGDDLYVIGGVIWPERRYPFMDTFSDVHVLTIGSKRPKWRQVASMTNCRGTILGCTILKI